MTLLDIGKIYQQVSDELCDGKEWCWTGAGEPLQRFAALIEQHLVKQGYRKCAEGQRTTQFCGMLEQAVEAEREECARVCDLEFAACWHADAISQAKEAKRCAAAIRARGNK